LLLLIFSPRLMAYVQSRDIDLQQHSYHFFLPLETGWRKTWPPNQDTELNCTVNQGELEALWPGSSATLRTLQLNPAPGDKVVAVCQLTGVGDPQPVTLQVLDPYAPGGLGGRMMQRVEVDGVEVFSQDIAQQPGSGWANIPLGNVGTGTNKKVVIEVKAINPEPNAEWAYNSRTEFRLARSPSAFHLATGRPATQSSTLNDYTTSSARVAVDGTTDGQFFNGSVTHTNREANAWWQVDLGASVPIGSIVIWNRTDCCSDRLNDYWVFVSDTAFSPADTPATLKDRTGTWSCHQTAVPHPSATITPNGARGRYVRVQLSGTNHLSLAEVQVFGK
jgi:hypothetical protein